MNSPEVAKPVRVIHDDAVMNSFREMSSQQSTADQKTNKQTKKLTYVCEYVNI